LDNHPNAGIEYYNKFLNDGYVPIKKPEHFFSQGVSYETLVHRRRYYDEYILYVDHEFGRIVDNLSDAGVLDDTWLILTSDHGEMFERGIWEHTVPTIHQPVIRVPLLISEPGQHTRNDVYTPTSSIDLLPTLAQQNGKDIPAWCEGEVLPPYRNANTEETRNLFAIDAKKNEKYKPLTKATTMILEWPYKLMRYTENKRIPGYKLYYELFNIEEDPEELIDLYSPDNTIAKELISKLEAKIAAADQPYL
jgi:arylsulfatase A-like enzyme